MLDQRGRLLLVAIGFATCSMPSHDRALWALRSWLDSWNGLGAVVAGMERQGTTRVCTDTPKAGVPRSFHGTTRRDRGLVRC
jgi:hypothetical protein